MSALLLGRVVLHSAGKCRKRARRYGPIWRDFEGERPEKTGVGIAGQCPPVTAIDVNSPSWSSGINSLHHEDRTLPDGADAVPVGEPCPAQSLRERRPSHDGR